MSRTLEGAAAPWADGGVERARLQAQMSALVRESRI